MREVVTIGIVDNDPLASYALISLLHLNQAPLNMLWSACSGLEALRKCNTLKPDVVLTDIEMPDIDGIALSRLLTKKYPKIVIIGLTAFQVVKEDKTIAESGIITILPKEISTTELIRHIGIAVSSKELISWTTLSQQQKKPTTQELQVLRLYSEGYTTQSIAHRMHCGETTVKTYMRRSFNKLKVNTRTEAISICIREGWI